MSNSWVGNSRLPAGTEPHPYAHRRSPSRDTNLLMATSAASLPQRLTHTLHWCRERAFRIRRHIVFVADAREIVPPVWREEELPVRFTCDQPLAPDLLRQLAALPVESAAYLRAVENGEAEGLVVCVARRIVHCGFLMFSNKTTCLLGFGKDAALLGNAFTVKDYRGNGCQTRSLRERTAMARDAGVARVLSETSPDNHASQRGLAKAGLRRLGSVHCWIFLNTIVLRVVRPVSSVPMAGLCLCGFGKADASSARLARKAQTPPLK